MNVDLLKIIEDALIEDCHYEDITVQFKDLKEKDWEKLKKELQDAKILCKHKDGHSLSFVGVICYKNKFFFVFPKYFRASDSKAQLSSEYKLERFKTICQVLRYRQKLQGLASVNTSDEVSEQTDISLQLRILILEDYAAYGPYRDDERLEQVNGPGAIIWQRTIQASHPVFQNSQPYYLDFHTQTVVTSDSNFFTRLHKQVAQECQEYIRRIHLQDMLDMPNLEDLDDEMENLGEPEYLQELLEQELCVQFDSRRRRILELLLAYEKQLQISEDESEFHIQCFGTNSFKHVWEDVCRATLGNDVHSEDEWMEPFSLNAPHWKLDDISEELGNDEQQEEAQQRGRSLDMLFVHEEEDGKVTLNLFDAKYYIPTVKGNSLSHAPGNNDISKQYLYQMILLHHGWRREGKNIQNYSIRNCLLLPACGKEGTKRIGRVYMPFFRDLGLGHIYVYKLDPEELYKSYLKEQKSPNVLTILNNCKISEPDKCQNLKAAWSIPRNWEED